MNIPTRDQAKEIAQSLIEGKTEPAEVAKWAQSFYRQENRDAIEKLERDDPILEEFISSLGMADLPGSSDSKLYTTDDFRGWLDEFLQQIGPTK